MLRVDRTVASSPQSRDYSHVAGALQYPEPVTL